MAGFVGVGVGVSVCRTEKAGHVLGCCISAICDILCCGDSLPFHCHQTKKSNKGGLNTKVFITIEK